MASGRLFSRSILPPLLHNQPISSTQEPLDSLFVAPPTSHFLGTRSMVCFEDVNSCRRSSERSFVMPYQQEDNGDDEADEYFQQPEKKRRLTPDQVQFLERSFEAENKLEPDRKIQLAKDLSLQPRQVAIWFQNRRARWKTKQLEKDYDSLQLNYNSLMADYESLLHEKEKLKAELILLTKKLASSDDGRARVEASEIDGESHDTHNTTRVKSGYDEEGSGGVDPLNGFEAEHSDLSQDEDEDARKFPEQPSYGSLRADEPGYNIPMVGPSGFGYPMEDHHQALWFWTY